MQNINTTYIHLYFCVLFYTLKQFKINKWFELEYYNIAVPISKSKN